MEMVFQVLGSLCFSVMCGIVIGQCLCWLLLPVLELVGNYIDERKERKESKE